MSAVAQSAVLVLNSGSSSIKYQLIDMATRQRLAAGIVERIGEPGAGHLKHTDLTAGTDLTADTAAGTGTGTAPDTAPGTGTTEIQAPYPDHAAAMTAILTAFATVGPTLDPAALTAIGHRVVHGGDRFAAPTLIDDAVVDEIRILSPLAPLHNPPNLTLIEVTRNLFPTVPQVAVFDTAFHQTLPPAAYTYAVPALWRDTLSVRRYGFHGTSHQYVARRTALFLNRPPADLNLIILHLGNGASATAVQAGRSVDTSMGLTPLEGLVMGTRSGDVDPALPAYLSRTLGLTAQQVDEALNKDSGLRALAGSNDMRDVEAAAKSGVPEAILALDVYTHRLRSYIGAYYATLGRVDAVVFTAGVGENSSEVRRRTLMGLEHLGIRVDGLLNEERSSLPRYISPETSPVAVLVVPTDEEIEIATQALAVVCPAVA